MSIVPELVHVAFKSTLQNGAKAVNTFYMTGTPGATSADLLAVASALATTGSGTIATTYAACLSSGDTLDEINVAQVPEPTTPTFPHLAVSVFPAIAGAGSFPGGSVPRESCSTITLQTGIIGRRFRGRMFIPGPNGNTQFNAELWAVPGTYMTAVGAFVTAFSKLLDGSGSHLTGALSGFDLCVFSKPQYLTDPTTAINDVTAIRQNTKVHWLRSRAK